MSLLETCPRKSVLKFQFPQSRNRKLQRPQYLVVDEAEQKGCYLVLSFVFDFLIFLHTLRTWTVLQGWDDSLYITWLWFSEGGSGHRAWQMEPMGAHVCVLHRRRSGMGSDLYQASVLFCLFLPPYVKGIWAHMSILRLLQPDVRFETGCRDVQENLCEEQLKRCPKVRDPHCSHLQRLTGPEASERPYLAGLSYTYHSMFLFVTVFNTSLLWIFQTAIMSFCLFKSKTTAIYCSYFKAHTSKALPVKWKIFIEELLGSPWIPWN